MNLKQQKWLYYQEMTGLMKCISAANTQNCVEILCDCVFRLIFLLSVTHNCHRQRTSPQIIHSLIHHQNMSDSHRSRSGLNYNIRQLWMFLWLLFYKKGLPLSVHKPPSCRGLSCTEAFSKERGSRREPPELVCSVS